MLAHRKKSMKSFFKYASFSAALVLLCSATQPAHATQNYAELSPQRIAEIATQLANQPAGLGPSCNDRQAWTAQAVTTRLTQPLQVAEKLRTSAFPAWDDEAYLEYSRNGVRGNGEAMMNARKAWLFPLVMAECVEGKGRFVETIEKTLTELSQQATWTWPAHDSKLGNFKDKNYEVDLLTADMAHDMAQALYLLGDRISRSVRNTAMAALEKRVFAPIRNTLITGKGHWWIKASNNWNPVCLGGVVSAALAVLPDRNDRALFVAAGEHYIKPYVSNFSADGYAEEGPAYWNYGFSHMVHLREAIHTASAGKIDLFSDPKTRIIALYGYRIEMLPGNIAAFGDAPINATMDKLVLAYVNQAFDFKQPQFLKDVPLSNLGNQNTSALTTAALSLFADPARAPLVPDVLVQTQLRAYFDSARVLVSRPNSTGTLAVSIKAGGNSNHSHDDIGSYTLGVGTEQPLGDVGVTRYSAKTFSKDRRTIRSINSWGHPVPVVAGQLQLDATNVHAKVLSTSFTDQADEMVIDMAPAYAVPALKKLTRSMKNERRNRGVVSIEDRFEFSTPQTFETAITTRGQWRQRDNNTLEFWQKDRRVLARLTASGPFELKPETVTEEGITFTRVGISLRGLQSKGFVRAEYESAAP
jgi:Heparinase II/III-like protein